MPKRHSPMQLAAAGRRHFSRLHTAPAAIRRLCLMRYDATAAADIIRYAPFGAPLSLMPNITTHSSLLLITCQALPGSPEGGYFLHPLGEGLC